MSFARWLTSAIRKNFATCPPLRQVRVLGRDGPELATMPLSLGKEARPPSRFLKRSQMTSTQAPSRGYNWPPKLFHITPALLREKFAAQLLLVWSRFRNVPIADIGIGSADHHVGLIGFIAAAVEPFSSDETDSNLPSVSTLRRLARELKRTTRDYGEAYIQSAVQIVR